jgi:hypothetical protein
MTAPAATATVLEIYYTPYNQLLIEQNYPSDLLSVSHSHSIEKSLIFWENLPSYEGDLYPPTFIELSQYQTLRTPTEALFCGWHIICNSLLAGKGAPRWDAPRWIS